MNQNTPVDPKRRTALGKGIESLLGPRPQAAAASVVTGKPLEIALDLIDRNPRQTRTTFDDEKLAELARSIATSGVVQPIVVREMPEGRYQLIMGERRLRASKIAKKATIPAIVRQASDAQAMEMTIIENLQREDLNPMEQARAFLHLSNRFNMTQDQMALRTGKDRASIGNFLRLLKLPAAVQTMVESGQISFGHGKALLALPTSEQMVSMANRIVSQALSVRQAETYVQGVINPEPRVSGQKALIEPLDPNVREARDLIQRRLGLKVRIEDKKGKGRVIIEYTGVDDFDAILRALGQA
jgi:ParB family chromosome partitioning protein